MKNRFTHRQRWKLLGSIVLVGASVFVLIQLITWTPSTEKQSYETSTVTLQDIQRSIKGSGIVLTRVKDSEDQKVVQVFIDEYGITDLSEDTDVSLTIPALDAEVNGTIDSLSDTPRSVGDVSEYEVIIEFDETPEDLRNGMHVDVLATLETRDDVIAVPNESLYLVDDQYFVDSVFEKRRLYLSRLGVDKVDQRIEPTEVSIGFEGDEYTEITEGVQEGDVIVSE